MRIGTVYKRPSKNAKRFFDGVDTEKADFSFFCGSCQRPIEVDLWDFLSRASDWEEKLSPEVVQTIKREIEFPTVLEFTKSHEGGQPYLAINACPHCSHSHLVYIGFYEFQPARYVGTLQGVYEVIT